MASVVDSWFEPLLPRPFDSGEAAVVTMGWPIWWALLGWAVAAVVSSAGIALAVGLGAERGTVAAYAMGQVGLWGIFVVTALRASRRFGSGHIATDFRFATGIGDGVRALALGVAIQLVVMPLLYLPLVALGIDLDVSGPAESLFEDLSVVGAVVIGVGVVAVGPVVEELLFRGVLLRGLVQRFGPAGRSG